MMSGGLFRRKKGKVLRTEVLGLHWDVELPFVFCVHHRDMYPRGNAQQAPPLNTIAGRNLGHDYRERYGFRMYHGKVVPGFPMHPHCGTETVTVLEKGWIDHFDTFGGEGRYGAGDVHWLMAGKGIQHCEMYPLVNQDSDNPFEMFQIWIDLPREGKGKDPFFRMMWAPEVSVCSGEGWSARVVAGSFGGVRSSMEVPDCSWAADAGSGLSMVLLELEKGGRVLLPEGQEGMNRNIYVYEGGGVLADGVDIPSGTRAKLDGTADIELEGGNGGCRLLLLEGVPVPQRTASYGPFYMNSDREVREALAEFRRTGFGEWGWGVVDKVHPRDAGRFERHP